MHKVTVGLLIFTAGWGLSWFTYNYPGRDPQQSAPAVTTTPSKSVNPELSVTGITSTVPAQPDTIASLLQRNEFDAVIEHYESLQFQSGSVAAANARTQILSHARQLVAESRFGLAEQLLQRFLVAAYRDVEAHILLAEVYFGKQDFDAAIDQLYEVRGYAYRPAMLQRIDRRIRSIVAKLASTLNSNNDQNALLVLYQHLTQQEPDHAP